MKPCFEKSIQNSLTTNLLQLNNDMIDWVTEHHVICTFKLLQEQCRRIKNKIWETRTMTIYKPEIYTDTQCNVAQHSGHCGPFLGI